jgi:putative hemolysin
MIATISTSDFTYASAHDAPWRRAVIRGIEHITGKPRLRRLYEAYCRGPAAADFFAEAVARLNLKVQVGGAGASAIPRSGPLVVIANHPFGVVDGIVLGYLVSCLW